MGKIVITENVTLDGVIEDPAGDEGFRLDNGAAFIVVMHASVHPVG